MRTKRGTRSVDAHEADGFAVGIVGERGVFAALDLDDPGTFVGEHEGDAVFFVGRREAAERAEARRLLQATCPALQGDEAASCRQNLTLAGG